MSKSYEFDNNKQNYNESDIGKYFNSKDLESINNLSQKAEPNSTNYSEKNNSSLKTNSKSNVTGEKSNYTKLYSSQESTTCFKNVSKSVELMNHESKLFSTIHIGVRTQDKCKLSEWGLPPTVYQKYESRGVTNMFSWQVECLTNYQVLEQNRNLVYSAPTSAGKTLVAEILILKTVLERRKKAIFILPFVSVVREKMYYFQDLLSNSEVRVEGFMGNVKPPGGFSSVHIAIATIEKANSLINRLIEERDLVSLGTVVIDELHLLGDPSRGYLLELLLTKLKYASFKMEHVQIQLIGMSATLPNLPSLAKWLDADLYKTDYRPIPLAEHCKIGDTIYDNKLKPVRTLSTFPELIGDMDNIFQICIETIEGGHGILIFCPTKNWCEKLALQIAGTFAKLGYTDSCLGKVLREQLNTTMIKETLEQLKRCPVGLDNVLKNTVSFGVAFHHAGLTMDERDIIEGSFRAGSLKVLTATSTLSSGVNLPARRVIIRSPMFNGQLLNTLVYRQMIGRAGRMGKDNAGESILICKPNEKSAAATLLSASLEAIESCLEGSGRLLRVLLEAVASQVVRTFEDLELYIKCTFAMSSEDECLQESVDEATQFLVKNEFLILQKIEEEQKKQTYIEATPLGKACLAAAIAPREGLFLFQELQKARKCFALDTELHILYLVTPYDSGGQIGQIDWMTFLEFWKTMEESERRVGQLVGVEERFLIEAMRGKLKSGKQLNVHRRFYTALALYDLVREVPLNEVCKKYNCCRGLLQSLQQSSATLAGMVTQFCKELGWGCMELLVSQFQARLQFGVCRDLLDLLRLPSLNGIRARSLYKEGIKSVADLATANARDVEHALNKAVPFKSAKEDGDEELDAETAEKQKMKTIFITGRDGLTAQRAALILIQEARIFIQSEFGIQNVNWQHKENESGFSVQTEASAVTDLNTENTIVNYTENQFVKSQQNKCKISCMNEKSILQKDPSVNSACNEDNAILNSEIFQISKNQNVELIEQTPKLESLPSDFLHSLNIENKSCSKTNSEGSSEITEKQVDGVREVETKKINSRRGSSIVSFGSPYPEIQSLTNTPQNARKSSLKASETKSPSLFGDSFLETSICSILEQNIFDSDFDKSDMSQFNVNKERKSRNSGTQKRKLSNEGSSRQQHIIASSENNSKIPSTTWNEVSWSCLETIKNATINKENYVVMKPKLDNTETAWIDAKALKLSSQKDKSMEKTENNMISLLSWHDTWESEIKNQKTEESQVGTQAKTKKNETKNVRNLRRSQESMNKDSPAIAGKKKHENIRKLSTEISDTDDIVASSQSFKQPNSISKSRLNSLQKSAAISTEKNSTIENENSKTDTDERNSRKRRMKNALKELQFGNVQSDSEEVIATKKCKIMEPTEKDHEVKQKNRKIDMKEKDLIDVNLETINVIRLENSRTAFRLFKNEIEQRTDIALALACESFSNDVAAIGTKVVESTEKKRSRRSTSYVNEGIRLNGVAFSWGLDAVYYMSLLQIPNSKITVKERIKILEKILTSKSIKLRCFATKEVYKTLYQCCNIAPTCKFIDPKVADWLLNAEVSEKSFRTIAMEYCPLGKNILRQCDMSYGTISPGLNIESAFISYNRAVGEVTLTWYIMEILFKKMESKNSLLLSTFEDIEMEIIPILARMELRGLGINSTALRELSIVMQNEMSDLQNQAFLLAGRKFNFCSPKEVTQVLNLPKKGKVSAGKAVLEKCNNPIANLIISWRRLNTTQIKVILPSLRLTDSNSRIRSTCITHTVTGRISMHEPNIQNVPKDFSSEDKTIVFSVRTAFVPASGNFFISADYCQLELRIMAHFSKDSVLCNAIRNQDKDIFKSIAALWNCVTEKEVDETMRQRTKQLCYGMIYGMGTKTLAETLKVTEAESTEFLEKFMSTFKGVRKWLGKVIEKAHSKGYVTTLMGRRRILPGLYSENQSEKSQAERQAVNTMVQGTAADIAKKAMVIIEDKIRQAFPDCHIVFPSSRIEKNLRSRNSSVNFRGGYLVLQLHDELLYEVRAEDLELIAVLIKESMEQVCQLDIPLPVKLKVGPTWGDLVEYNEIQ